MTEPSVPPEFLPVNPERDPDREPCAVCGVPIADHKARDPKGGVRWVGCPPRLIGYVPPPADPARVAAIVDALAAPRQPDELPTQEQDRLRRIALRALAERDLIRVGIAHRRGVQALFMAIGEFVLRIRPLTPAEEQPYRFTFYRALTAYQESLEGESGPTS